MPTLVYSTAEFIEVHGGRDAVRRLDRRTQALPDGALIVLDPQGYERHIEPSADPKERALARRRYHQLYLEAGEHDFAALRSAIKGEGVVKWSDQTAARYEATAGMTDEEMVGVLSTIRQIVLAEREAVRRIDMELADLPEEAQERQKRQEREALQKRIDEAEMARMLRVRAAADAVTLDEPETEPEETEDGNADVE